MRPRQDLPLVSVVVPTRDRPDAIARCLDCLAAQSWPKLEVIVVDDASGEPTRAALAAASLRNPGLSLRIVTHTDAMGANPSRNRGVAASQGTLVAFCDDDCFAEPGWVEALVDGFDDESVGAVTGLVLDPPARNVWELALRGNHRVHGETRATRLVAGNMCVRRELLDGALDEDRAGPAEDMRVSGRGDEEGLFLRLRARGLEVAVRHDAVVLHVHPHDARSFLRQAWRSGEGTARLGLKYQLVPRAELVCLLAAWPLLLGGALHPASGALGLACVGLFLAAISWNERVRKHKSLRETLQCLPALLVYYHVRAAGYARTLLRAALRIERVERVDLDELTPRSSRH